MNLRKMIRSLKNLFEAAAGDSIGTTRMFYTYFLYSTGKLRITEAGPTEEEMRIALNQLKDLPRLVILLLVFLMPVPGFVALYIFGAILTERFLGNRIKVIPNRYRSILLNNQDH